MRTYITNWQARVFRTWLEVNGWQDLPLEEILRQPKTVRGVSEKLGIKQEPTREVLSRVLGKLKRGLPLPPEQINCYRCHTTIENDGVVPLPIAEGKKNSYYCTECRKPFVWDG